MRRFLFILVIVLGCDTLLQFNTFQDESSVEPVNIVDTAFTFRQTDFGVVIEFDLRPEELEALEWRMHHL